MQIRRILGFKAVKLVFLQLKIQPFYILRKILLISLLALLIYNSIGFVISFQHFRYEWQLKVREQLAISYGKNEVTFFTFHENNPNFNKHEFEINGQFYDVISREIQGDSVVLKCFSDEKETQLIAQFQGDIQKNIAQKTDYQKQTQLFFTYLLKDFIFENEFHLTTPPSVFEVKKPLFSTLKTFYPLCFIPIEAPPPEEFV